MRVLLLKTGVAVVLLLALAPAAWTFAQGPDGQGPAPSEVQAHYTKGEVWYDGAWVRMAKLLDDCRKARKAIEAEVDDTAATRDRVSNITKTLAEMDAKYRADRVPLEHDLAQAREKGLQAARVLAQPPPAKPSYSHGDGDRNGRSRAEIQRENERRQQQYQAALNQYQERRQQAQNNLNEAESAAKQAAGKLEKLYADYKAGQKPLLTERTQVTQDARSTQGRVGAHQSTILRIAAVLAEAPEGVRARFGVVEWQKSFWSIEELKDLHTSLEAEIRAGRKEAERGLADKNQSMPSTWTHPRQAEADALKARIAGAEADMQKAERAAE